jgi:CheY-like chemotaxis protein
VLDGLAAVERYCSSPESFDVILMDCEMPNMDGFEASKQIRAFEEQLQTKCVTNCALTAHAMDVITDRCLAAGMDEVLIKPVDLNVLTRKLQEYAKHLAQPEIA